MIWGRGTAWLLVLVAVLSCLLPTFSQPTLSVTSETTTTVRISWEDAGGSFALESSAGLGASANWQAVNQNPTVQGAQRSVTWSIGNEARFFRLMGGGGVLTHVAEVSPVAEEQGVAVTRETILTFSAPLAADTILDGAQLYAEFGGRRMLSRVELSSLRNTATLFFQENLPASAQISVFFHGDGIKDAGGRLIDADGDGFPGGIFTTRFTTLGNTPVDQTAVIGHVYAAEKAQNGANVPLAGVTITVDGEEQTLRAVTDAQGFFRLLPAPAGRFFVHIDGRTLTDLAAGIRYPDQAYYPFVGKAWEALAGQSNNLAGGTGEIFLPLIQSDALKPVSALADTVITVSPSVIAANPAFQGVTITVPANSLFSDNGTRGGKVGIAPVPPDRLPSPLPPGLEMPLVITVQTDGGLNFDRPAPICFPNFVDPVLGTPLPAGSRQSLVSFNHDKGVWEAVGTATVSADGKLVCSDPGSGIRQPGWHGIGCPSGGPPGPPGPQPPPPPPPPPDPPPDPQPDPPPDPCAEKGRPGGDPGCGCEKPGPNALELELCFDEVRAQERECRATVEVRFQERVRGCVQLWKDGLVSFQDYQDCMKGASADKKTALGACTIQANKLRKQCVACAGPPSPLRAFASPVSVRADAIIAKLDELAAFLDGNLPPEAEFVQRVDALLAETEGLANGDVSLALLAAIVEDQRAMAQKPPTPFLQLGNAPPYPIKYAALLQRRSGELVVRGDTLPYAQYTIFIPRDAYLVRVMFYDPVSKTYGEVGPDRRPEAPYLLPRLYLPKNEPGDYADKDGDGLSDAVEFVYGTNASNPDSDGDGLRDGVEVLENTNPLDGMPAQIGVIASVKTQGNAVDICAFGNYVALAEGTAGVSIFDVADFSKPVRVAQIDTPGTSSALRAGNGFLAVADGATGLTVIDVSTPAQAAIRWQVALPAAAISVAIENGTAVVGLQNGSICLVDLPTGQLLQTLSLGSARVLDVLLSGNAAFAYADLVVHGLALEEGALVKKGQIKVPGVQGAGGFRYRLSGGDGLIYAVHAKGFGVIEWPDVTAAPKLVANHETTQFGWKQVVPNSGGLGVAAVGINSTTDGPHDVYLHDLRPGGTNSVFLNALSTPGFAGAVALQGRLAYVADGAAGLQIINYLPSDLAGVPPAISLAANFSLVPPQAESGQAARVTALATDDVLVGAVEFYLDGELARRDESFPFEFHFFVPGLTAQKTSFVLRARAMDTAGNEKWTEPVTIAILADATPPKVLQTFPPPGTVVAGADRVSARFSEAMNPASFTPQTLRVISGGPDLVIGTADDQVLPATPLYNAGLALAQFDFPGGLPNGAYRLEIQGVRDAAGIPLAAPALAGFFVAPGGPEGDPDGDGLSNVEESTGLSNPFLADTDGDGWVDEVEVHDKKDPRDPASQPEFRIVAGPVVQTLVVDLAEILPAGPGPILSQPIVDVVVRPVEEADAPGPWVSQPVVDLWNAPQEEAAVAGPWMAQPLVDAMIPDALETATTGPILARPPVTVKLNP